MASKQRPGRKAKRPYGKILCILAVCVQLLMADAAFASSITIGQGYMNIGGSKDIHLLPDETSDVISALPVGAPCDVLTVSGDWVEIKAYSEMLGFFTGWVTAGNLEKAGPGDPLLPGNDPSVLLTPVSPEATPPADAQAPQPTYTASCSAVVNNINEQRLHLRSAPSTQAASLGLYYTGTQVVCYGDPAQEWVYVSVGNRFGYMKTEFLYFGSHPESIPPRTPVAYVSNSTKEAWLNLRALPSLQGDVLGKYDNGDRVLVLGQVNDWYHVKAGDVYGFMQSAYLALTDASPATQTGALRQYGTTQYIPRGYTLSASMTENAQHTFDLQVTLTVDPAKKLNAYPASFILYINGVEACSISPVQDAAAVAIPTQFAGRVSFLYHISLIQLVPVNSAGTALPEESVFLR